MDFVIVVGSQRSGTTLMGQMLGSHPQAVLIDEDDKLYAWTNACFYSSTGVPANLLFNRSCRLAMTKYLNPDSRFQKNGQLLTCVKYAVLKAPNLTYCYNQVAEAFPNAKIVYMLRDIRDVVASMINLNTVPILKNQLAYILASRDLERTFPKEVSLLRRSNWIVKPYLKLALIAKIKMSLAQCFEDNGLDVIEVRYEELVSHPEQIIKHLGIPDTDQCLRYHEVLYGDGPGGTRRDQPLEKTSIGKWKSSLSHRQVEKMRELVGDFMEPVADRELSISYKSKS